jgi:hypothetical protein
MVRISEIQLQELEKGAVIYNRRYKFIMSTQEKAYLSMLLSALFKYWLENGRRKFIIGRTRLQEYINDNMPPYSAKYKKPCRKSRACGNYGLRCMMHVLSPVFIEVQTKFQPDVGRYQRLYKVTPLLCEWFRRKS